MRLRIVPVEYKECPSAHCQTSYEGQHCPRCRQPFDPQRTRKTLRDRLILVDVDPPVYEPVQRCRCIDCKNLFDLSATEVAERATCSACRAPLFNRTQIQEIWKDTETLLQKARKLERARRQMRSCVHCAHPIELRSWCPTHDSGIDLGTTGGLPQNLLTVWVRTFQTAESVEEIQDYERLQNNEATEE
jgi:hypothetical protein